MAFSLLSRRRLLKFGLSAGALVAGAGGGLFALRGRAPLVEGLRVLSPHGYRTMASLAQVLFPEDRPGGTGARLDLARAFDTYLADEPSWAQAEARQALVLLEFGPVVFERRLFTFSNLEPASRLAHFEGWARSQSELRRQVALGLKKFLSVLYYDQKDVWPDIGYDGPLFGWREDP